MSTKQSTLIACSVSERRLVEILTIKNGLECVLSVKLNVLCFSLIHEFLNTEYTLNNTERHIFLASK